MVPAVLVVGWLGVGVVGGALPGRLAQVQSNNGLSFLPVGAESTEAVYLQQGFAGGSVQDAVVVFSRDSGLTAGDRVAVGSAVRRLGRVAPPPEVSADGRAVRVSVPVPGEDGFRVGRTVAEIRSAVRVGLPAGLAVQVTGTAGFTADLGDVFGGIDGRLLAVTAAVVALILVVVYRSPLLPLVVLLTAGLALVVAAAVIRPLAQRSVLVLSGQSQGILFILVFGACTDYALLLVARYREELAAGRGIRSGLRATAGSVTASAATVALGLPCLLLSTLASNRGLGPVAAIGIAAAWLTSLTFLPAVLVLLGRAEFWPRPLSGVDSGVWTRVAALIGRRAGPVWTVTALLLAGLAAFAPGLRAGGVDQDQVFLHRVEAVVGQDVLAAHFPAGGAEPVVIFARAPAAPAVLRAAAAVPGVTVLPGAARAGSLVAVRAVLAAPGRSAQAADTVRRLRTAVHAVPGAAATVGGEPAIQVDIRDAAHRDRLLIVPAVLAVIYLVLALLLRALVVPLLLIGTVVLSFAATLGVGALVFNQVLHFPGSDPSVPLYAFLFLVALGVDYNIFLMTRVREEAARYDPRTATLRALAATGGVISSAGIVLAATFAALSVLPILFLAQLAFLVSFGVLLDTLVVRSLLVPALTVHIGRLCWWPGVLYAQGKDGAGQQDRGAGQYGQVEAGDERGRAAAAALGRLGEQRAGRQHLADPPGQDRAEQQDAEQAAELGGHLLERGGQRAQVLRRVRDDDLGGGDERDAGAEPEQHRGRQQLGLSGVDTQPAEPEDAGRDQQQPAGRRPARPEPAGQRPTQRRAEDHHGGDR